jgi:hypothetical protein
MATEIMEGWSSWNAQRNGVEAAHDAVLLPEAQRNPSVSARDLKAATAIPE